MVLPEAKAVIEEEGLLIIVGLFFIDSEFVGDGTIFIMSAHETGSGGDIFVDGDVFGVEEGRNTNFIHRHLHSIIILVSIIILESKLLSTLRRQDLLLANWTHSLL